MFGHFVPVATRPTISIRSQKGIPEWPDPVQQDAIGRTNQGSAAGTSFRRSALNHCSTNSQEPPEPADLCSDPTALL